MFWGYGIMPVSEPPPEPAKPKAKPLTSDDEMPDDPTLLVYVDKLETGEWSIVIPELWITHVQAGQLLSIVNSLVPTMHRHRGLSVLFEDWPQLDADEPGQVAA